MSQSNFVHLENCTVKRETAKALLVAYDGTDYWIPLSQIADPDALDEGDTNVTVSITEWCAEQKGIEVE